MRILGIRFLRWRRDWENPQSPSFASPGRDAPLRSRRWRRARRFPVRQAVLRTLRHPLTLEPIDRALITRFEAPASFTGEDLVELSVTGGRAVISATAQALILVPGLRPAEPGEFAWRAFVNGKIDLSEVEGLADLVDAETEAQRRQAQRIAGGALHRECEAIRSMLLNAMATIEAQIDFSDVEDAENLTVNSVKHAARDGERPHRPRARRREGGRTPAGGLRGRHCRAAQCREIDPDECARRPRCRDHLPLRRNDARSDRGLSRSSRISCDSGRHGRNPGCGRSGRTRRRRQSAAARQAGRSDALA